MNFSRSKIQSIEESTAEKIRLARKNRQLELEDVSKKINISLEHLKAIEDGNYELLPGGVYQKTFIKKYAAFLGLDAKKTEESYLKESGLEKKLEKNVFNRKKIKRSAFLVFPKILRGTVAILTTLAIFFYLGFYLKNSFSKPEIEIIGPADNLITEKKSILVSGQAEEKTQIEINNKPILKDKNGGFQELVELKKGINTIIITAQNKYSQKRIIKKQILVK